MVDRPPPTRFSVVERGGRLVVIDKETGKTPLSAAERMDLHDRNLGIEPVRPDKTPAPTPAKSSTAPDLSAAARAESGLSARPAPVQRQASASPANSGKDRVAATIAERGNRPWKQPPTDRPALTSNTSPAQVAGRPAPHAGGARKTIVTSKWWDAKGPRTIELGAKGQQTLTGSFVTLFFVTLIAAIVALFIAPVLLFVGGFLLFRFGGTVIGPIGAGIVDKAIAERN